MKLSLEMIYLHQLINARQTDAQLFLSNTNAFQKNTLKAIDDLLNNQHFNGHLVIEKNGEVVEFIKGFENLSAKSKITENAIFYAGSITKFITGIIIEQLIDEGKLSYEDTVTKWLPQFPYKEVTIEALLLHRSGLAQYKTKNHIHGIDASVENIRSLKRVENPQYDYNDANYILLAKVIELITNTTYESNVTNRLIHPYELNETYFENEPIRLTGSYKKGIWLYENRKQDLDQYIGAGHLKMSLKDIQKLSRAFIEHRIFDEEKLKHILRPLPYKTQKYRNGISVRDNYLRIRGCIHGFDVINYFNSNFNMIIGTNMSDVEQSDRLEKLLKSIYYSIENNG